MLSANPEKQNCKIESISTINNNHMMYASWDMKPNRWNFLSFWTVLPFYPIMDPENQNFEIKKKKTWRYYHFTNVHHKWHSYDIWLLRYGVQQTDLFVILDHFLLFYPPPLTTWKINILKKWKKTLEILSFYTCIP